MARKLLTYHLLLLLSYDNPTPFTPGFHTLQTQHNELIIHTPALAGLADGDGVLIIVGGFLARVVAAGGGAAVVVM
jgi:hypothetical protein